MLTTVQNRGVMEACEMIAPDYGRSKEVIYQLILRFRPSVDGAEAYMRANALRLAMRVVRKANAEQSMDILSRPNIGVLAPKTDSGGGNQGFFLSVQADTCGAVKITAGAVQTPQRYADLPQPLLIDEAPVSVDRGSHTSPSLSTSPSSSLRDDSGYAHAEVDFGSPDFYQEEPPETHPYQGKIGRFQRPREEWGKRHQLELDRARQRLKEARRAASAAKYYEVDV